MFDLAIGTLAKVRSFYEENRPDLFLYGSHAFAGLILAREIHVPAIKMNVTFANDRKLFHEQIPDGEYRRDILKMGRRIDDFLAQHGLSGTNFLFDKERLNLYLFPKALQPRGDLFGEDCVFAGRCPAERPCDGEWSSKKANGRPIVLVSASTCYVRGPEYFKMCLEAFKNLPWHVVLLIGGDIDPAALGPLPPHCEVDQHTPLVKILPHVNLLVCMGGIITTSEAVYHGVPLLVTSHGIKELELQADNLDALGIGIHLNKDVMTVESMRKSARKIIEEASLSRTVCCMQDSTRRSLSTEEVADRIENYMHHA